MLFLSSLFIDVVHRLCEGIDFVLIFLLHSKITMETVGEISSSLADDSLSSDELVSNA